ncbi:MAG: BrnT family toxin [Actinomycetota bacterium]
MATGGPDHRPRPKFDWEGGNEEKLLMRHKVSALEAEQCFVNPHTIRKAEGDAYLLLGKTDGGRMLLLVYQQKPGGVVRVYSAREMTERERRAFQRQVR